MEEENSFSFSEFYSSYLEQPTENINEIFNTNIDSIIKLMIIIIIIIFVLIVKNFLLLNFAKIEKM